MPGRRRRERHESDTKHSDKANPGASVAQWSSRARWRPCSARVRPRTQIEASTDLPPVVQKAAVESYADLVQRVSPGVVTIQSIRTVHQASCL